MNGFIAFLITGLFLIPSMDFSQEIAPPHCAYGKVHPAAPKELSQFDFLIGDYLVTLHAWQKGSWSPPKPGVTARWNGYYGLDGMAIIDEWYNVDPEQDANTSRGINVRVYDPKTQEWKMMWVSTGANQVQDLRAKIIDGHLTMWQIYPERKNFRATFEVEDSDHWSRVSYSKNENGEWVKAFKLRASRIPCGNKGH